MDSLEYEKVIKACRFCLMCRHLCTVGNITYAEANTPRGQALMLDCLGSAPLEDTPENRKRAAEVLFTCCYCGQCQNNCVSSYRHPDAIMRARAGVKEEDLPERVKELRARAGRPGGLYEKGKFAEGRQDVTDADVLLYIGSYALSEAPETVRAAIGTLEKAGLSYTILSSETGTGTDEYLLGMADAAQLRMDEETAKIKALNPKRIAALSAMDQRALSGDIPGLDPSALGIPVISFSSLALELIRAGKLKPREAGKASAAYHDGDQSGRFLQEFETQRDLIKALPGVEYTELYWGGSEAASAGESGAINLTDEELALKIARKRMGQIEDAGIDIIVTDSAEVKTQLSSICSEKIQVVHIAEFLYPRI